MNNDMKFSTKAIGIGEIPNLSGERSSDVVSAIHVSSTFAKPDFESEILGFTYSRLTNPTRSVLEQKLSALEGAKHTICYASGQAAELAVILSILKAGDTILCFDDIYGGTRRILSKVFNNFGIIVKFIDMLDLELVKSSIDSNVKAIWVETPTNPLLQICDLGALAQIAKDAKIISVCDNTFASPYLQRPLEYGFDISLHSMTKYINGHSDSIAGAVCLNDEQIYEKLRFVSNSIGAVLSPFDSYLNARGLKTLEVRMERHCANALEVAKFLDAHPKVAKVIYPGLSSHPQHDLAKKQMNGLYGGVICVYLDTDFDGAKRFAKNLDIFILAESLGGVESLFGMPYFMSHGSVEESEKERLNITKNMFRLSIGIENVEDIKNALSKALGSI